MSAYDTPSGFIIANFPFNQNSKFTCLPVPGSNIRWKYAVFPACQLFARKPVFPGKDTKKGRYRYHPWYVLTLLCLCSASMHHSRPDRAFSQACSLRMIRTSPSSWMWSMSVFHWFLTALPPILKSSSSHRSLHLTDPCPHLYHSRPCRICNRSGKSGYDFGKNAGLC